VNNENEEEEEAAAQVKWVTVGAWMGDKRGVSDMAKTDGSGWRETPSGNNRQSVTDIQQRSQSAASA
jgi:hypothetical protein